MCGRQNLSRHGLEIHDIESLLGTADQVTSLGDLRQGGMRSFGVVLLRGKELG